MIITPYSILFSFLGGSFFFLFLIPIRRYLLKHCAYNILLICSLFAIFQFVFIFDFHIPLYSDFLYQVGKGITLLVKKVINNSALQINVIYNWNILKQVYDFFKLFIYIWILGFSFLIYKDLTHFRKIMNLYKEISQSNNPALFKILRCVKTDMKLDLDVRIIESEYAQVPFLYGFFRPIIYLDTSCFLNENEIYAVIYHELTHFVRHDNWLKFFLHCIHILYWWNPMIRILSDNICDACEYRCDQFVTKNMNNTQKIDYASIINRMTKSTPPTSIGVSLVSNQSSDHVYERLHTFLYPYKMNPTIRFIITSMAGIMVTISLLSILFISQTSNGLTPTDISITAANSYLIQNEDGSYDLYCMDELIDINLRDLTNLPDLPIKQN